MAAKEFRINNLARRELHAERSRSSVYMASKNSFAGDGIWNTSRICIRWRNEKVQILDVCPCYIVFLLL